MKSSKVVVSLFNLNAWFFIAILQAGGGSKESSEEDSDPECQNGPIQVTYFSYQ